MPPKKKQKTSKKKEKKSTGPTGPPRGIFTDDEMREAAEAELRNAEEAKKREAKKVYFANLHARRPTDGGIEDSEPEAFSLPPAAVMPGWEPDRKRAQPRRVAAARGAKRRAGADDDYDHEAYIMDRFGIVGRSTALAAITRNRVEFLEHIGEHIPLVQTYPNLVKMMNPVVAHSLRLQPSTIPGAGTGLFVIRNITGGTTIGKYIGKKLSNREYDKMYPPGEWDGRYTAAVRGGVVDSYELEHANLIRFINFGDDSKANVRDVGDYLIVAKRDIDAGEELFWNYGSPNDPPFVSDNPDHVQPHRVRPKSWIEAQEAKQREALAPAATSRLLRKPAARTAPLQSLQPVPHPTEGFSEDVVSRRLQGLAPIVEGDHVDNVNSRLGVFRTDTYESSSSLGPVTYTYFEPPRLPAATPTGPKPARNTTQQAQTDVVPDTEEPRLPAATPTGP